MKLTGELKEKIDAAETLEEKKAIIAEAGIELTDDELDSVAGGYWECYGAPSRENPIRYDLA